MIDFEMNPKTTHGHSRKKYSQFLCYSFGDGLRTHNPDQRKQLKFPVMRWWSDSKGRITCARWTISRTLIIHHLRYNNAVGLIKKAIWTLLNRPLEYKGYAYLQVPYLRSLTTALSRHFMYDRTLEHRREQSIFGRNQAWWRHAALNYKEMYWRF